MAHEENVPDKAVGQHRWLRRGWQLLLGLILVAAGVVFLIWWPRYRDERWLEDFRERWNSGPVKMNAMLLTCLEHAEGHPGRDAAKDSVHYGTYRETVAGWLYRCDPILDQGYPEVLDALADELSRHEEVFSRRGQSNQLGKYLHWLDEFRETLRRYRELRQTFPKKVPSPRQP